MPGSFFDSNVLIYLLSGNSWKADRSEEIIAKGGTISVQILNEILNVSRRKMRMSWAETRLFMGTIRGLLDVVPVTIEAHDTGLELAERHDFSTFDAMVVAAALLKGCDTLWSEDMQDGMTIDGRLRIVNPYRKS